MMHDVMTTDQHQNKNQHPQPQQQYNRPPNEKSEAYSILRKQYHVFICLQQEKLTVNDDRFEDCSMKKHPRAKRGGEENLFIVLELMRLGAQAPRKSYMRRSLLVALVLVICGTIYLSGWKRLDPDTNLLLLDTANNADEAFDTPIILPREEEVSTAQDYEQAENLDDSNVFPTSHPSSPVMEETEAPTSKAPGRDETDAENLIDLALLDSEARNNNIPKQPRRNQEPVGGAFIHLGKTGGSTLTSFLRNGCIHHLRKPCSVIANETIASRLITHYYHVQDFFKLPDYNHTFYMISLRDPYERTVSGFVYGHPSNYKVLGLDRDMWKRNKRGGYFQPICFRSLEAFVENVGDHPAEFDYPHSARHVVQRNCTNFARAMLNAKIQRMHHLYVNYVVIRSLMPQSLENITIYATRKDHLMDDFRDINYILGEREQLDFLISRKDQHIRDVSKVKLPVTRDLSDSGRERLCRALEPEYRVYVELLLHSDNLSRQDVIDDLIYSRKQCSNLVILSESYWEKKLSLKAKSER